MEEPVETIERLGHEVAQTLDRASAGRQRAVEQARRAFLENAAAPGKAHWHWGWAAACGVMAVLVLLIGSRDWGRLTFTVNGRDGGVDAWLAAGTKPVSLNFSDGTALRLERSSKARVVDVSREGARIALESGSLHADVVHTGHSAWFMVAGPLSVRVTGTRFDMSWNPLNEEFSIAVSEGSVRVSGSIAGSERAVGAGERLLVSVSDNRLELTSAPNHVSAVTREQAVALEMDDAREALPLAQNLAPAPAAIDVSAVRAAPDWKELLKRGELRAAFANAERVGFKKVCDMASAAELLALGDAARVSNRPERVNEALLSLRRRFPRDARSSAAAFALGKVAFDQKHAYAEAARWFSTSMRERPNGSLAREAAGRYIESVRAAGDRVATERAARDYLARYPDGPHAALARSLLP
ncbi:MAG: FecR domain-containing protein [Myxococcota bacterium]